MSGYAKHDYEKFIQETKRSLKKYVESVSITLPEIYEFEDIVQAIADYYPYEWRIINERYTQYTKADKKLPKFNRKRRYNMPAPCTLLREIPETKRLLSEDVRHNHRMYVGSEEWEIGVKAFYGERQRKNAKRKNKIDKALERAQRVEPEFLDRLIGLYDRKNTSQKDRVYIMHELEKYYCPKTISFFQRIAHAELNFQLREEAVRHLLSLGHYAKLRKQKYMQSHVGNKKRRETLLSEYAKDRYSIEAIPEELEYRIQNSKEQQIKTYDYFISHSSIDYQAVQLLIDKLNNVGVNVYCDWVSDSDYLKRHLLCDATLDVIEKRILQAKAVLFLDSENSRSSQWVKYELNYAAELGKDLCVVDIHVVDDDIPAIKALQDNWYLDSEYKRIKLIPSGEKGGIEYELLLQSEA